MPESSVMSPSPGNSMSVYGFGMRIGARLLLRGRIRQSLPFLIRPVNYWRALEYSLVLREGEFGRGDRVLDIGSPKLLALYLAKTVGAQVFATDIDDYFVQTYGLIRALERISPEILHVVTEDGRKLRFNDHSFDKVYSISVLQHIPEHGDAECVREIARVLAPGGRCLITVPFAERSGMEYLDRRRVYWARHSAMLNESMVFYQRRYNEQDLFHRLIEPSGLRLRTVKYVGERVLTNVQREVWDYLPVVTGPIQPLLSQLFHTRPADRWRDLKKPLCALIVLERATSDGRD